MGDLEFEAAYTGWFESHSGKRRGERSRRLLHGHGHAEKLLAEKGWWPAFGHFDALHPEYEITDFHDGTRFLDFAYIPHPLLKTAIEVEGYGPYLKNISRTAFSDQLIRQNQLTLDGWRIFRFSYDDIIDRSRMYRQILQQFKGMYPGAQSASRKLAVEEKEVLRMAMGLGRSVKPGVCADVLGSRARKRENCLRDL